MGAQPSLPSGAADLEALIPDTIGGVALQKLSMQGNEFANSGGASAEVEDFLRNLGVSPDDVSVAIGFGLSTESGSGVAVFVFRAEGADSGRLLQAFKDATDAERDAPLEWESANVGGKRCPARHRPRAGQPRLPVRQRRHAGLRGYHQGGGCRRGAGPACPSPTRPRPRPRLASGCHAGGRVAR